MSFRLGIAAANCMRRSAVCARSSLVSPSPFPMSSATKSDRAFRDVLSRAFSSGQKLPSSTKPSSAKAYVAFVSSPTKEGAEKSISVFSLPEEDKCLPKSLMKEITKRGGESLGSWSCTLQFQIPSKEPAESLNLDPEELFPELFPVPQERAHARDLRQVKDPEELFPEPFPVPQERALARDLRQVKDLEEKFPEPFPAPPHGVQIKLSEEQVPISEELALTCGQRKVSLDLVPLSPKVAAQTVEIKIPLELIEASPVAALAETGDVKVLQALVKNLTARNQELVSQNNHLSQGKDMPSKKTLLEKVYYVWDTPQRVKSSFIRNVETFYMWIPVVSFLASIPFWSLEQFQNALLNLWTGLKDLITANAEKLNDFLSRLTPPSPPADISPPPPPSEVTSPSPPPSSEASSAIKKAPK